MLQLGEILARALRLRKIVCWEGYMRKREWALLLIVYLALTELLSLHPVPDLSLCLMQSESADPSANDDDEKYCPAFHAGVVAALEAIDGMLESHDKSVVLASRSFWRSPQLGSGRRPESFGKPAKNNSNF